MKLPCEVVVRDILPVVKAIVVKELADKYKLTQLEIASKLGITQASVSYYLTEKRGYDYRLIKEAVQLKRTGKRIAKAIAENASTFDVMIMVCRMCRHLRSRGIVCELHESSFPSLEGQTCRVCETTEK